MTMYGLLNLSFWGYVVATLVMTHITIACVTIFLHRHQAHRALTLHPAVSHFFRFWLWLTTGIRTREWVSIHRKHHAKCETEEDPHSPVVFGIKQVLWQGYELYRRESHNTETLHDYGQGVPNDFLENKVYDKHSALGILLMLFLDLLLFGVPGIIIWAVQMAWIPFFAAGVINGIGHFWGYRNFECTDAARNILPWGILIGGEELHNNHHTFGTSAKLSVKPWEFDIGWFYIRLLERLKLAQVKKLPATLVQIKNKHHVDAETIKALILNRFHIMANYTQDVVVPVLHMEKQKAGEKGRLLLKRAKTVLTRADILMSAMDKKHLLEVLHKNQALEQVYHFRQKLQGIWSRTTASQKELIEDVQEWCKQAEGTGVDVLKNFSQSLRQYSSKQTHA